MSAKIVLASHILQATFCFCFPVFLLLVLDISKKFNDNLFGTDNWILPKW